LLIVPLVLAACGADGPPVAPSQATAAPGVQITGEAQIGITGGS
jgi:predicted small lipoprotein YifL